ncbi:MAG: TMEM165/GDT1 family protein [Candidatus Thermoplasmatota archaeon]|nr:TMEM165/GDT1 family protein [Candidatus Thermoplasmatota archaeon]
MSWLAIILIAFALIVVAELGDKTQLMTISLACKYKRVPVFWGVFLGMSAVTILGVAVGTILYSFIPLTLVKIIAADIFILFGLYIFLSKENEKKPILKDCQVFRNSFALSAVAELGDKTQFAVIGLTARYAAPVPVLVGSLIGLALIIGVGVLFGHTISNYISSEKIRIGTAFLFIGIGALFFAEVLL